MHRSIFAASAALALLLAAPAMAQDDAAPSDQNQSPAAEGPVDDAQDPGTSPTADSPQEFATMAASSNMLEIASSQLAVDNAQQGPVREFAQRMIDDHTQASEEMAQAAEADGVTEIPETMNQQHQQMVSQLEGVAPEEFDSRYIDMQVRAHEEAVALFNSYSGQEGALADFAETTLPTLEEHLALARELSQGQ